MSLSRFQNAFPSDPPKAFGKQSRQPTNYSSYIEQSRFRMGVKSNESNIANLVFPESAMSAFGKKTEIAKCEFQEDASYAFGKKPVKDESRQSYIPNNTIASRLQLASDNTGDWSSSALRKIEKPLLDISEMDHFPSLPSRDDMFPALGSSPKSIKMSKNPSKQSLCDDSCKSSPKVSFVDLVKKRAEDDLKEAEETMKREVKELELRKKREDELKKIKLAHIHYVEQSKMLNKTVQEYDQQDEVLSDDNELYPDYEDNDAESEKVDVVEENDDYDYDY